jgi:signal transduction histidine kinase
VGSVTVFREWVRISLQRRLLVSLLLGVGICLAAFQIVVDQLVDRHIASTFDAHAVNLEERDRLLREVDLLLLSGVVTVLGVCALATVMAVRRGLEPLGRVGAEAQRISIDHSARALTLVDVPAEIQPLCIRFNQLIARLTEALENERRFAASLAHELRTPLAEIRTLGEAGLAREDVAGLHEFLRQTTAAAIAMQGVIESLLAVARADRAALEQALEPMPVAAAVRARCDRLRITEPEGFARIVAQVPEALWIQSEPRLFDVMLMNLLTNAIQHGDRAAPIEIKWLEDGSAGSAGALEVRNLAPRLSREELPRLLDRSAALGLWVVRSLCGKLGLTLSLDLDETSRLSVRLAGFRAV